MELQLQHLQRQAHKNKTGGTIRKGPLTYKNIRSIERMIFPEFESQDMYCPNDANYIYFSPAWHFKQGLVDLQLIKDLRKGKNMISIGAGNAYLERYLTIAEKVPHENIILADETELRHAGFSTYLFDMDSNWPQLPTLDYVLFPESVLINTKVPWHMERDSHMEACRKVEEFKRDCLAHLINSAFKTGAKEIRMDGHCQTDEEIARALDHVYRLGIAFNHTIGPTLIVKRT